MGLHKPSRAADLPFLRRSAAWQVPVVLAAFSVMIALGGSLGQEQLRYDRAGIEAGEIWRLVTGHFAHLGFSHLVLNLAGLAVVWLLVGEAYSRSGWLFVIALSVLLIDCGFWFLDTTLSWYVGMSGLLHALLVAGIVRRIREVPRESLVLGAVIAFKIAWEQLAGPLPGSEMSAGGPVVVNAHLYGTIAGVIAAGVHYVPAMQRRPI